MAQTETRTEAPTRTIARLWQDAVAAKRKGPAYLVERDGEWQEVSWAEAAQAVEELAHGLISLGLKKGDSFAILGSTTLEWSLFDFALASIGVVAAPIYANSSPGDCAYVIDHSDAVGVLVEDEAQRAKVADLGLQHVYSFAELDALRGRGREHAREHPRALEEAAGEIGEDDLFTFIYTSGTTGPPKGCMIRHRNYYAMCEESAAANDVLAKDDVLLLFLPLAHNFGRLVHLLGPHLGFTIAFCPDPLRAAEALLAVRPTVFPSVPRVYEKIHTAVSAGLDAETGAKRKVVDWALRVGKRVSQLRQERKPVPPVLAAQHRLADRLVYSKVKQRLGGRLRVGISGGAPLAKEILEFFHMLDILILEGYGLTECTTAATVNRMQRFRFGTVGLPYDGVELRIADDGEVLIRCPTVFAGYYKDEQATREVLGDDGWLRSGDIGAIDSDGFLTITDRKKDILVTAGGKNVAPQNLENALKSSRYVSQALVVGDRKPYVAALITLDEAESVDGDVREVIQRVVDDVNANLSRYEQLKRFTILPRDFSAELGEVTPTMKLKRRVCEQHFADEIAALYA